MDTCCTEYWRGGDLVALRVPTCMQAYCLVASTRRTYVGCCRRVDDDVDGCGFAARGLSMVMVEVYTPFQG